MMTLLNVDYLRRYGWALPALLLLSLPLPGGGRPVFWASVLIGACILLVLRRFPWGPSARRLCLVWSLLVLPVMLSLPGSVDPLGTWKVLGVLVSALPAGLCWLFFLDSAEARWRFDRLLVLLVLFSCVDGFWQAFFATDLFGIPQTDDGRVVGPFSGNLRFPVFLSLLVAGAVAFLASQGRTMVAILLWVMGVAVVVLGGTRAQIVTLIIGAVALLPAFAPSVRHPRLLWVSLLAIVGLAAGIGMVDQGIVATHALSTLLQSDRWFETLDTLSSSRLSTWQIALAMGVDRFAGVGASAFTEAYASFAAPGDPRVVFVGTGIEINHAHHVWFAIFAETGIIGLTGLLAALVLAVRWWGKAQRSARAAARPYAVLLITYLFPGALHPPLYLFWIFPLIWLFLCLYLAALSGGGESSPSRLPLK